MWYTLVYASLSVVHPGICLPGWVYLSYYASLGGCTSPTMPPWCICPGMPPWCICRYTSLGIYASLYTLGRCTASQPPCTVPTVALSAPRAVTTFNTFSHGVEERRGGSSRNLPFSLRINLLSGRKPALNGKETRYREYSRTRRHRISQPSKSVSKLPSRS